MGKQLDGDWLVQLDTQNSCGKNHAGLDLVGCSSLVGLVCKSLDRQIKSLSVNINAEDLAANSLAWLEVFCKIVSDTCQKGVSTLTSHVSENVDIIRSVQNENSSADSWAQVDPDAVRGQLVHPTVDNLALLQGVKWGQKVRLVVPLLDNGRSQWNFDDFHVTSVLMSDGQVLVGLARRELGLQMIRTRFYGRVLS